MKYIITISEKQYERIKKLYEYGFGTLSDSIILEGIPYEEQPHGSWDGKPERKPLITRKCTACGESSAVGYFCMWCGSNNQVEVGGAN